MNKIAIIGGGAAGLMAALTAANAGAHVTLYEHNTSVGKKILASGNGRCNIVNTTANTQDYFGQDPSFVNYALEQLPFSRFESFCLSIGLLLDKKDDGRCYPLSNEAKSVVTALHEAVIKAGVNIVTQVHVKNFLKEKTHFVLQTDSGTKNYDKILVATGSQAAPQLGATDDGYAFAQDFEHTIIAPYPSLVQLHVASTIHAKLAGVKAFCEVTLYLNGKPEEKVLGDTLFTRYGLSGLAILDISQKASLSLQEYQAVSVGINLLPRYNRQALSTQLEKLFKAVPDYTLETALLGMLPTKVVPLIIESAKLSPTTLVSKLTTKTVKKLSHQIQDWRFEVIDTHGFKHAEVSGGGVATCEINERTMESKLISGLYFAGEVLDIVGKRGGYNFNFAWASGIIAGKELART